MSFTLKKYVINNNGDVAKGILLKFGMTVWSMTCDSWEEDA